MKVYNISLGDSRRYEKFKYPAGELQVRLKAETNEEISSARLVTITARIKTAEDVIETCLLCSAVRGQLAALSDSGSAHDSSSEDAVNNGHAESARGGNKLVLILPYLPYGRADRRFVVGDCFGLEVFANILNGLNVVIITLDAHSSASKSLIDRLIDISPEPLMEQIIRHNLTGDDSSRLTLLFPDEGARKRYAGLAGQLDLNILHCTKMRDQATGKLMRFAVPGREEFKTANVLLVDDICDGGGTFIGIADALQDYRLKLSLYVTHGLFSKGLSPLLKRFEKIYTTDSIESSAADPQLIVYPTAQLLEESALGRVQEKIRGLA